MRKIVTMLQTIEISGEPLSDWITTRLKYYKNDNTRFQCSSFK